MTQIKLKRVYENYNKSDGFRVLVDRLWPRGMKKEHLHYDLWAKDITPSPGIRKWFHEDMQNRWDGFSEFYRKELSQSGAVKRFIDTIAGKDVITLLYASKEPEYNHARILQKYIEQELLKK